MATAGTPLTHISRAQHLAPSSCHTDFRCSMSSPVPARQKFPVSVGPRPWRAVKCKDIASKLDFEGNLSGSVSENVCRRQVVLLPATGLWISLVAGNVQIVPTASAGQFSDMPALRGKDYGKTKMRYTDYVETTSGLQYKDLREGVGQTPEKGDMVVIDWDGYTIGYYGRIFEARNKAKGGSFEGNDKVFFKFRLGMDEVIPAFEEAISTMHVGGVRRIIVPPDLGYPDNDFNRSGPRPTTFSGQRALDFVLRNQGLIDKTLLFDIELLKVINE